MTNIKLLKLTKNIFVSALVLTNIIVFSSQSFAQNDDNSKRMAPIISYILSIEDILSNLNITDPFYFSDNSGDCTDYARFYEAFVSDVQNSNDFTMNVAITNTDTECTIVSNTIPNHNFNATGNFATMISEIERTYTIPILPELDDPSAPTANSSELNQQAFNAVFLNGVPLDLVSAGCYDPENGMANENGQVQIGCTPTENEWMLDPLFMGSGFGSDEHNAHTQPDGTYHYHGNPKALFENNELQSTPDSSSPVIGFASDGFPIYGAYINDNGVIRQVTSSYELKAGSRGNVSSTNPGGTYDGTYVADWEFTGSGDLDECNGMTVNGQYGYYVTNSYPWVMACHSGTPSDSFRKGVGGGGNGGNAP